MAILRLEEEKTVHVIARAQNGTVVEDVMFDWDLGDDRDTVNLDPSDDTMSADVEAAEEGETTITITAVAYAIAADINIEVTGKVGSIALKVGSPAMDFEAKDSYFPGDSIGPITAVPDQKFRSAGDNIVWKSDNTGVAKVVKAGDNKSDNDAMNTVMVVGTGTAMITAEYEDKEASFEVVVPGSRDDLVISHRISQNTFTYKLASTTPVIPAVDWSPSSLTFEAVLEDADGDPQVGKTIVADFTVPETGTTPTLNDAAANLTKDATSFAVSGTTGSDGTVQFTVTAPDTDGATVSSTSFTITLSANGAKRNDAVRIHAVVEQQ
ncbi:MAG: hypothetical protein OXO51_17240 [Gemmatimonadota bacterium]|nr:hypothetical protein [Gemmatimonadota bacterium]